MRSSLLTLPLASLLLFGCGDPDKPDDTGVIEAADADGDGYDAETDCDDTDPAVHPGATEACNGGDDDCDGEVDEDAADALVYYPDLDGDGFGDPAGELSACSAPSGYVDDATDCDDEDAAVNPGADELCNGVDDDCDGLEDDDDSDVVDPLTWYEDVDADGYGSDDSSAAACEAPSGFVDVGGDCDDADPAYNPGADESDCTDPADYNCDGSTGYADADADGYPACEDCDDSSDSVHPGADEYCDGLDNDCDGTTDNDALDARTWYADDDGDGRGDPATAVSACTQPSGTVSDGSDCDDSDGDVWPGAPEYCDGVDSDCDGTLDEDDALDATTWYIDYDSDGYGSSAYAVNACAQPSGYVADDSDCDDADAGSNPGAAELCDGVDNDCDGETDEDSAADAATWYIDYDGDGFGSDAYTMVACSQPSGWVGNRADCDDTTAADYPGADEYCDGADNDCDGTVDEHDALDASTLYQDSDGDGFGDPATTTRACTASSGWVADATDCDDGAAGTYPGATEFCDGIDTDCDGATDEDEAVDAASWYADVDGDGYGDPASTTAACSQPSGYLSAPYATDCDDTDPTIHPGADEYCDGIDTDCDGTLDDPDALDFDTWYADVDSDGYGDPSSTSTACSQPSGYAAATAGDDCDDADATVNPGAGEYCDGVDNDCDGMVDEDDALDTTTWYAEADGDGYGDPGSPSTACTQPSGTLADSSDCDDTDSAVFPGADEYCDGVDNDCDGAVDEDDALDTTTWYLDADGDGYGTPDDTVDACAAPTGYVSNSDDCDDGDATVVECGFDGTTGTSWETLASAPTSLMALQTYHSASESDVIYNTYSSTAAYYDPNTNTWTSVSSTKPYTGNWTQLAPWDGKLWEIRNSSIYSYDLASDTWTTVASTSWTDDANMTVSDEYGVIYGYDGSGNIAVYDTVTGTQTSYASGLGSEYETRLGYDPGTRAVFFGAFHYANLYKFDIATGSISTMASHPESYLNDIFCSDQSGHIYSAGGSSGTTIWQYDIATDSWSSIPDLPVDHGNNYTCTVSDTGWLYVGVSTSFYRLALY